MTAERLPLCASPLCVGVQGAGMKKTVAPGVRPSVEELLTRPERALSIHPLSICSAICEGRVPCRADFAE